MAGVLKTIGVVGAGQIGTGMALLVSATARLPVKLVDLQEEQLSRAHMHMERWLQRQSSSGLDPYDVLSRISVSLHLADLHSADFVLEAVTESFPVKAQILRDLSELCRTESVFATTTMSFPISKLAAGTSAPERVIGMNFFNHPTVVRIVEIIPGLQTSQATLQTAINVAEMLGKSSTISKDRPGFIANRVMCAYINEGINSLSEGVGSKEDIDAAVKEALRAKLGPLELADYIGLDVLLDCLKSYHRETGDDRYRPSPLLANFVNAGWLGRKSGRGFYSYDSR